MQPKFLTDFFDRAKRIVTSHHTDRDQRLEGGELESSWAHIARVYVALTGKPMDERDALTFMQCVKFVREQRDPRYTQVHYDDLIGYTALKGAARHKQHFGATNGNAGPVIVPAGALTDEDVELLRANSGGIIESRDSENGR